MTVLCIVIDIMKKLLITLLTAVGLLVTAQAALIDLGITTGQPASPSAELSRLTGQIDLYNAVFDPDLTKPTDTWSVAQTQTPDGGTSITLNLLGFDGYMMMKWGGKDRFYYVNDLVQPTTDLSSVYYLGEGTYRFDSDVFAAPRGGVGLLGVDPPLGLSHYTAFTAVPEPPTSIMGVGCLTMCVMFIIKQRTRPIN